MFGGSKGTQPLPTVLSSNEMHGPLHYLTSLRGIVMHRGHGRRCQP